MPHEYTCPPKLKLIVDHLKAVRILDEYVSGVGLKKDMQELSNHLQRDISTTLVKAGWTELYLANGCLYSEPSSKWRVVKGDNIAMEIYPAWPVQNPWDSYVNLYVPPNWKKRHEFLAKLKAPAGFQHVNQFANGELTDETSIFRDIKYETFIDADGAFDAQGFIDAFREAAQSLVRMEAKINGIIERLA